MKPLPNLSFSCQQNRVDYQYIPEHYNFQNSFIENLNLCQLYEKSLSSSFLAPLQLHGLSINSSISFEHIPQKNQPKQVKEQVKLQNNTKIEFQVSSIGELGLDCLVFNKKLSTKNVLRNFGNAQNQYIFHNTNAQNYLQDCLDNKNQFFEWIRKMKLFNFEDYKNAWMSSESDTRKQKLFKKIYKTLCWQFYEEQCIPYIFSSRLSNENKKSHQLQIYKMLKGIQNPKQFQGFKA